MRKIVICNDSDHETVEKCRHIYQAINDLGIPVTIAVFCKTERYLKEDTQSLKNKSYVKFLKELKAKGNEIAFHGYSEISNTREQFKEGIKIFKKVFGEKLFTYIEHGGVQGHHEEEICKKEVIGHEGAKSGKYHVLDLIIKNFKVFCPTSFSNHQFNEDRLKELINDGFIFKRDFGFVFMRDFFHNLPNTFSDIVYTHFGYESQLVGWHEENLKENLELLKELKKEGVKFVTMKEYVNG